MTAPHDRSIDHDVVMAVFAVLNQQIVQREQQTQITAQSGAQAVQR